MLLFILISFRSKWLLNCFIFISVLVCFILVSNFSNSTKRYVLFHLYLNFFLMVLVLVKNKNVYFNNQKQGDNGSISFFLFQGSCVSLGYSSNCANWNCKCKIHPTETCQFCKNSHLLQKKSFPTCMKWFSGNSKKWIFCKTTTETDLIFIYRSLGVHKSHDHSLVCYNLQETSHIIFVRSQV